MNLQCIELKKLSEKDLMCIDSHFVSFGISVSDTAFLKALHPGVWGFLQLATGPLSDRVGRKRLIYPGMIIQALGIWIILLSASSYFGLIIGMSLLGVGTALVYPTLLAAMHAYSVLS
jgi:MFS family permease